MTEDTPSFLILEDSDEDKLELLESDFIDVCKESRKMGFEECILETLSYLTIVEGRSYNDPLVIDMVKFLTEKLTASTWTHKGQNSN